jgi:transcriptional regulator with XRE-family HTH domain
MQLYEKINYLLLEQSLSKKQFAQKFLALDPKLRTTGEPPSTASIYSYLIGKREIKVELIPYIAEALSVKEQELFEFNIEYATEYNHEKSRETREILDLLQYLPPIAVKSLKDQLKEYKKLYEKGFKL